MRKKIFGAIQALRKGTPKIVPYNHLLQSQHDFFSGLKLSDVDINIKCKELLSSVDTEMQSPLSFHLLAFTALQVGGFRPTNILELGTFQGKTTALLSELFPAAMIYTVDLPETDIVYEKFREIISSEKSKLTARISKPNIKAIQSNTAWMLKQDLPEFDLIWVDAWHKYPEVAWDHMFAMNKLSQNGWLFSDDIWLPDSNTVFRDPTDAHAFETIHYFHSRTKNGFKLTPKRQGFSSKEREQKYIAYFHNNT
jgi:predicted O-methyltransferase YrrM